MKTALWVFRSKIGFTILLLIAGIFVAMSFSGIQQNRIYVLLAREVEFSLNPSELSTYTLVFYGVEPNMLQIPPSADGLPLLVPTNNFLLKYTNMSPGQFNILLTYLDEYNDEKSITIFEGYPPAYDPIKKTISWPAKIFDVGAIPGSSVRQVTTFISLK